MQACLTLNMAPKGMGQSRVVNTGSRVGCEATQQRTQFYAPPITTLGLVKYVLPPCPPQCLGSHICYAGTITTLQGWDSFLLAG